MSNAEHIERLAADWVVRQQGGEWTEADQAEFDTWIAASTAHRLAYIRLDTMWSEAGRLKAIAAGVPCGTLPERGTWGATRSGRDARASAEQSIASSSGSSARRLAVAAGAVIVVLGGLYAASVQLNSAGRHATSVGAIDTVRLPDGSSVTLNTDSRIRVAYDERERRVELDRGEAFFQVGKDSRRPFVVVAGERRVVAIGTQFSVRREEGDVRVAVAQGLVRVERPDGSSPDPATPQVLLGAGSVAQTAKAGVLVKDHAVAEVDQLLSWRQGYVAIPRDGARGRRGGVQPLQPPQDRDPRRVDRRDPRRREFQAHEYAGFPVDAAERIPDRRGRNGRRGHPEVPLDPSGERLTSTIFSAARASHSPSEPLAGFRRKHGSPRC